MVPGQHQTLQERQVFSVVGLLLQLANNVTSLGCCIQAHFLLCSRNDSEQVFGIVHM